MKPGTLNLIRPLSAILCVTIITLLMLDDYGYIKDLYFPYYIYLALWLVVTLILLISLIYRRSSIKKGFIRFSVYGFLISLSLLFILKYLFPKLQVNNSIELISDLLLYTMIILGSILFLCTIHKAETLLLGLTLAIPFGYLINRIGIIEGELFVCISFLFSSICFLILLFRNLTDKNDNKLRKTIFSVAYGLIAILDILMVMKFYPWRQAFSNALDLISVIIFLSTCIFLFMTLPFSNYIEWLFHQKAIFQKLIVLPLIMFMLIISLKFILPETTYRKIFYREYSEKNVVYFNMKNYKIEFSKTD